MVNDPIQESVLALISERKTLRKRDRHDPSGIQYDKYHGPPSQVGFHRTEDQDSRMIVTEEFALYESLRFSVTNRQLKVTDGTIPPLNRDM